MKLLCARQLAQSYSYLWRKKNIDITKYNFIFIPMFGKNHWNLILVTNFADYINELLTHLKKNQNLTNLKEEDIKNKVQIFGMDSYNIWSLLSQEMKAISVLFS